MCLSNKMTQSERFRILYNRVAALPCDDTHLEAIKLRYATDIKSSRRLENARSLDELLKLLLKRDCLNETNLTPLVEIGAYCGDNNISSTLPNRESPHDDKRTIIQEPLPFTDVPQQCSSTKEKVYHLIATEIGSNWQQFARALDIREGRIEELYETYPRVRDRIYKVLHYYESNCDPRIWKDSLMNALVKARRTDLKDDAQKIFNLL